MCAIRLIVSDLDGTLLSPEHRLTDEVVDAIESFVKRGGLFTFATGRPFLTAAVFEKQLKLGLPYILCNGSVIAQKGEIIESRSFEAGEVGSLLEGADQMGIDVLLFQEQNISVFRSSAAIADYEAKERVSCRMVDRNSSAWAQERVQKIILMGNIAVIRKLWEKYLPQFAGRYVGFQSEHNYWEIIPHSQSKGTALRRLADLMGIRSEEIMALGNQMNDLDMIQYAGIGVAVANSNAELKAEADYVCESGYGAGVVEAIRRFCQ